MEMINNLHIDNYKSINHLTLNCSRINVLIGEPNVGKSNILEALDLSYLPWMMARNNQFLGEQIEEINLKEYFRVEKVADMFHLGDISKKISVQHFGFSTGGIDFQVQNKMGQNIFTLGSPDKNVLFDNDFIPLEATQYGRAAIHPYRYKPNIQFHDLGNYINILMPPYGNNLIEVIQSNPSMVDITKMLLEEYGFELALDRNSHKLSIQLRRNPGQVYLIPWISVADTMKRFLFYISAIRYNNAHVITLEEPDVHSFPKYVSFLADEIIENERCQFFIATHSPYLLNNLIENTPKGQLAVFVCGYDKTKFETTIRQLSNEDLSELLDYGVDIFFNINRYLDEGIEHHS